MANTGTKSEFSKIGLREHSNPIGGTSQMAAAADPKGGDGRHREALWNRRMLVVATLFLTTVPAIAEPKGREEDTPNEKVVTAPVAEQVGEIEGNTDESPRPNSSRFTAQDSFSTEEQQPDGQPKYVGVSIEEPEVSSDHLDGSVYQSLEFNEYHWRPDCQLVGKGEPKAITLDEAKRDGVIECGVCSGHARKKVLVEKGPKRHYLGNRRKENNDWRRPMENNWRESVEYEWRLNAQTSASWRDGRN